MDRPEPGLIKWSPTAAQDSFMHINLQQRAVELYEPTGYAQRGRFDRRKLSKHGDFPPITTYDWSPSISGLVAVGTSTGVVNLLRVDDNSNGYLELGLKMSRTCQAVAFNTQGQLAVGLDRVRSDQCLYIWDVNRLSSMGPANPQRPEGFPKDITPFADPTLRLEPSVSVSSVKFFEDSPQVLVAGVKGQGLLRMHDLRDQGQGAVITFQTKCCNNLSIDYADQNYFASSALDQPSIRIWDRRATSRPVASLAYLEAIDKDEVPWGAALTLDRAMEVEADPTTSDSKNSFIRSIRFNREHAGMLAVLSRTGQLKIFNTKKEHQDVEEIDDFSPELLEVRRSDEMDPRYEDISRRNDKIVSFDWVTLGSPVLRPRMLVLRANGAMEILEKPSFTSEYMFKAVTWRIPYRGLEERLPYHDLMEFEGDDGSTVLRPLFTEDALSNVQLFGPDKMEVRSKIQRAINAQPPRKPWIVASELKTDDVPHELTNNSPISEKLQAVKRSLQELDIQSKDLSASTSTISAAEEPRTQRERHDRHLTRTIKAFGLPDETQRVIDHFMLYRAKEKLLFDFKLNQKIVAEDDWMKDVWAWIAGAESAAEDGGMMSHPLDLSYLGIYSIWMNRLGSKAWARLSDGSPNPDVNGWERCLNAICKKQGIPGFNGVETKKPYHRQLCLEICEWGRSRQENQSDHQHHKDASHYTMTAAHAIFRGDAPTAVQILKNASKEHPELAFVSLALQLIQKGGRDAARDLDFDEQLASRNDPYLRAISSLIATGGDWAAVASQTSLPLRDRVFIAVRALPDAKLTSWLETEVAAAKQSGDISGVVLTGISDELVDVLARYVQRFGDVQSAALILALAAPKYIDDFRATAMRTEYRRHLQRHRLFFQRVKFEVESTRRSKYRGVPTIAAPRRQIALRCIYCDDEWDKEVKRKAEEARRQQLPSISSVLASTSPAGPRTSLSLIPGRSSISQREAEALRQEQEEKDREKAREREKKKKSSSKFYSQPMNNLSAPHPFVDKSVGAGLSCPNCKRHFPRCVVCLEVVGIPRSSPSYPDFLKPPSSSSNAGDGATEGSGLPVGDDPEGKRLAARFPTFCMKCQHVLHLDHARMWFARHEECPVPECDCKCARRSNPDLLYQ